MIDLSFRPLRLDYHSIRLWLMAYDTHKNSFNDLKVLNIAYYATTTSVAHIECTSGAHKTAMARCNLQKTMQSREKLCEL